MGFQTIKILGKIELDMSATSVSTLDVKTDEPGEAMTSRVTLALPIANSRRTLRYRLPGFTKGHFLQVSLAPTGGTVRLYGARVWARELPNGLWAWYRLPVVDTPDEYNEIRLPIPETAEAWNAVKLPIPDTSEAWNGVKLPIPETSEAWETLKLPIPETPENYSAFRLPVKETPPVPDWISIQVDE